MLRYKHRRGLLGIVLLLLELCAAFPSDVRPSADVDKETVLAELLRTKQPIIVSKTDPAGQRHTITYSLSPDGQGIFSAREIEMQPKLINSPADHASLLMSPNLSQKTPAAATASQPSDPENDWEWAPAARTNYRTLNRGGSTPFDFGDSSWPSLFGNRQPATGSAFGNSGLPRSWNVPDWFSKPDIALPEGVTPKTITKTEVDDQGRTVTTTTKIYKSNGPSHWPDFFGNGNQPMIPNLTPQNPSSWPNRQRPSLFDDADWHTLTPNWPSRRPSLFDDLEPKPKPSVPIPHPLPLPTRTPSLLTTTTVSKPINGYGTTWTTPSTVSTSTPNSSNIKTTTPLPSLDDFLKQQYGPGVITTRHRLEDFTTTTPRTLATINIDELPTADTNTKTSVKIPANQPIDDDWLRSLDNSFLQPSNSHTKVTSISRTYNSAAPPSANDLDPHIRDILSRAGINDQDIENSQDGSVTRTRTEPDGRVIQTTYRVRTVPRSFSTSFGQSQGPFLADTPSSSRNPTTSNKVNVGHKAERSLTDNENEMENLNNEIDRFLAKVNLTPSEILAQNGEVIKTFVDNDGRVLSVTFVLSTVKGEEQQKDQLEKQGPTK